ncbi:MAG: HAMP domain-containing histidine kinase [Syntrophaceae bacterium]|nr:HAMP domain-containing histidine kinase [Syntrophaceae bacterium]
MTDSLELKVNERTEQLEQSMNDLKKAQELLAQRERMANLGSLVGGIAHEMNTPVGIGITSTTYLKNLIKDLEKKYLDASLTRSDLSAIIHKSSEAVDLIFNNLNRSSALIENFNELALDRKNDEMNTFSFKDCCELVLGANRDRAAKSGISINIVKVPEGRYVGYSETIFQIFTILIGNAIEHAFPGDRSGTIEIEAERQGNMIVMKCRDNGVGLEQEIAHRIYEPFVASSSSTMGSGLGLNIVFNLVNQRLGGTIQHRIPPGGGLDSLFPFRLKMRLIDYTKSIIPVHDDISKGD